MNPKLDIFDALAARIKAEVPEIKTFKLYNNQFAKENAEKAFAYPALMVEFSDLSYWAKSHGLQEADTNITFYLGFASLKTEDRAVFEVAQKVNIALQGFASAALFAPLNRKQEQQDSDHDGVIVWKTTYTTLITDNTANSKNRLVRVTPAPDLGIDTPDVGIGVTITK